MMHVRHRTWMELESNSYILLHYCIIFGFCYTETDGVLFWYRRPSCIFKDWAMQFIFFEQLLQFGQEKSDSLVCFARGVLHRQINQSFNIVFFHLSFQLKNHRAMDMHVFVILSLVLVASQVASQNWNYQLSPQM